MSNFDTNSAVFNFDRITIGSKLVSIGCLEAEMVPSYLTGVFSVESFKIGKKNLGIMDATIRGGGSGGGIFLDEKFVGVTIVRDGETRTFFIKSPQIKKWLKKMKAEFLYDDDKLNQMDIIMSPTDEDGKPDSE